MMSRADGLVQRRNVNRDNNDSVSRENGQSSDKLDYDEDIDDGDSKETRLTLMEEVLLLGLKDKEVCIYIFDY
jgi:Golgi phosphoprotein 3